MADKETTPPRPKEKDSLAALETSAINVTIEVHLSPTARIAIAHTVGAGVDPADEVACRAWLEDMTSAAIDNLCDDYRREVKRARARACR